MIPEQLQQQIDNLQRQLAVLMQLFNQHRHLGIEIDQTPAATLGASVAGSDTQVQFNDGGALGADAGLLFDKNTGELKTSAITADNSILQIYAPDTANHASSQLNLAAGNSSSASDSGGTVNIDSGMGGSDGSGGDINLTTGAGNGAASGGGFYVTGGAGGATSGTGGGTTIQSGAGTASAASGGAVDILAGAGASAGNAQGGSVSVYAGGSRGNKQGGQIQLSPGNGGATGDGGDLFLLQGSKGASGNADGNVFLATRTSTTTRNGGFAVLPISAGPPTGTPTAGSGSVVFDSTNNDLYIYKSGWKKVNLA